jgi:hypothetical protein
MILFLKDPKNSTQKLLDIINSYRKVAGYKINIEKSLAFLYSNNESIALRLSKAEYHVMGMAWS